MPQPAKPGVDWPEIERRYRSGETTTALAAEYPVSRQAIDKRARKEGWALGQPSGASLATVATFAGDMLPNDRYGLRTPENAALALDAAALGMPITGIAARLGMTAPALKAWRDAEPEFSAAIMEAYSRHASRHLNNVGSASDRGDARAAQWLLERNPVTREAFAGRDAQGGPTLVVNINVPRSIEDLRNVVDVTPEDAA